MVSDAIYCGLFGSFSSYLEVYLVPLGRISIWYLLALFGAFGPISGL